MCNTEMVLYVIFIIHYMAMDKSWMDTKTNSHEYIEIKQVLHEEDLAQHVLFDTGRKRTQLGILKKNREMELMNS